MKQVGKEMIIVAISVAVVCATAHMVQYWFNKKYPNTQTIYVPIHPLRH